MPVAPKVADGVFTCSVPQTRDPKDATCGVTSSKENTCGDESIYLEPCGINKGGCVTGRLEPSFDERTKATSEEIGATPANRLSSIPQEMAKQLEERVKKLGVTVTVDLNGLAFDGSHSWVIKVIDPTTGIKYIKGWGTRNDKELPELAIVTGRLLTQVEIDRSRKVTLN